MHKVYFCFAFTFCLSISSVVAQKYFPGTITFINGEKKSGLVKPPNNPEENAIELKETEDSKKEKFKSEELNDVLVNVNGIQHRFVRKQTRQPKIREPKTENDYRYKDARWLVILEEGHTILYASGPLVKIKEDGRLQVRLNWNGRGTPPDINFYIENESYAIPTWIGLYSVATFGQMKIFKHWATRYFADHTALVKRIENEEFEVLQISDVVTIYNQWKEKK